MTSTSEKRATLPRERILNRQKGKRPVPSAAVLLPDLSVLPVQSSSLILGGMDAQYSGVSFDGVRLDRRSMEFRSTRTTARIGISESRARSNAVRSIPRRFKRPFPRGTGAFCRIGYVKALACPGKIPQHFAATWVTDLAQVVTLRVTPKP